MSKIKANTVEARKGNTLTLGGCGTTVQLACGAVNGINAEVDWVTSAQTSDFTAEAGKGYFVDTTSNAVSVTLPASPSVGDGVSINDFAGTFGTNGCILDPNGKKIEGVAEGVGITSDLKAVTLTFTGDAQGWLVLKSGDSTPLVSPTITFDTASGSLGTLLDTQRSDPNGNLSPVTATTTFGTLTYAVQSGSLPSGLTLNSSTGAFVGTADQVVTQTVSTFTIRASIDVSNFSDRQFTITVKQPESFITATGGTISTVGDYKIHVFTGPGTFCVSCAGDDPGSNSVEYIVVAGGGSGGGDRGGGGGAGGLRNNFPSPSVAGLPVTVQGYPITVGGGASGVGDNTTGTNGSNSTFSSITSAGGGGGGTISGPGGPYSIGLSGGSGGGSSLTYSVGSGNTPPVSPPQGNPGSSNPAPLAPDNRSGGGGGGGHTSAASNGGPTNGGTGGAGTQFPCAMVPDSYGSPARFFSGGGGGGRDTRSPGTPGPGGNGGGTNGSPTPGSKSSNSPANSGGGSGGGSVDGAGSGNGGSGIVVIRYKFQ